MAGTASKDIPIARASITDPSFLLYDASGRPVRVADDRGTTMADPGKPPKPTEKDGTTPRALIPRYGQNLTTTPRQTVSGSLLTPFQHLRALGDFDLCRVAIEDVKGQLMGMEWTVQPREEHKDATGLQEAIDSAKRWISMPDPLADYDWGEWLTRVLEELLVTDAVTLFPHFTRGGTFIGLEQLDGASVIPQVDKRGRPPMPYLPAPDCYAYIQMVEGLAETGFRMGDLWYLPMNRRVDSPYGRPPNEQVIIAVNIAIRHSLHDLGYYTEGNLPDALWAFPEKWTETEIKDYQIYFDAVLQGRITGRSGGLRFVPEGNYVETKTKEWQYDAYEWLGRLISWSYGVSPLPIAKQQNRSTSETLESSFAESGVRNRAKYIARIINRVLWRILKLEAVEFSWGEDETEDAATVTARQVSLWNIGGKPLNEIRKENGDQPYPEAWANKPMVMTGAGPVLLESAFSPRPAAPGGGQVAGAFGTQPQPVAEVTPPRSDPSDATAPADPLTKTATADEDLALWRRVAVDRMKHGKKHRPFSSEAIPDLMRCALQSRLERATSVDDVVAVFQSVSKKKIPNLTSPASADLGNA